MNNSKLDIFSILAVVCVLIMFETGCGSSERIVDTPDQSNTSTNQEIDTGTDFSESNSPRTEEEIRDSLNAVLKDDLKQQYQSQANRLTTFYILAQQRFYSGEYEQALILVNRAVSIKVTADVLALKGSIHYGLGSMDDFIANWRQALDLDANVPIPPSPPIIEELKRQGLLNENLERNY